MAYGATTVFRTVQRNTVTLCEQTAGNVDVKTSVNAATFGFWIMKDVSSTSLNARHFKTDDMKSFFHQNFTAQFKCSQSEVQFTTNTNPSGKAMILNPPPPPSPSPEAKEEFPEQDIRLIHFLSSH